MRSRRSRGHAWATALVVTLPLAALACRDRAIIDNQDGSSEASSPTIQLPKLPLRTQSRFIVPERRGSRVDPRQPPQSRWLVLRHGARRWSPGPHSL